MFALGLRDPSEVVRCQAISCISVNSNLEAIFLLDILMNDPSEHIRFTIAEKLVKDVPSIYILRKDKITFIKNRNLLLTGEFNYALELPLTKFSDTIIPQYYNILYSWACDAYCEKSEIEYSDLEPNQVLTGLFILLDSLRYCKDLCQIFSRLLEFLKTKFIPSTDENSYILFAKLFDYQKTPYVNQLNYHELLETDTFSTFTVSIKEKSNKLFMWQMISEFCCHPSLSEETKVECRTELLPTMVEFTNFAKEFWKNLEGDYDQHKADEYQRIVYFQNNCAKILLQIYHSLDPDTVGMYVILSKHYFLLGF